MRHSNNGTCAAQHRDQNNLPLRLIWRRKDGQGIDSWVVSHGHSFGRQAYPFLVMPIPFGAA